MRKFAMPTIDVHAVLDRIDLAALCEEAGARFDRRYASRCPLHPGADNPSAFHLYRSAGGLWRWHCFTRCQRKHNDGNAIDFYMLWKRVDFMTAYNDLSRRAGLDRHAVHSSRTGGLRQTPPRPGLTFASGYPASTGPEPVEGPSTASTLWQARAASFVAYAREQLHGPAGAAVRAYLLEERGLYPATVERWGLGYNPRDVVDDPARWGQAGRPLWCPRGIVIPAWHGGRLRYVKVRRPAADAGRDPLAEAIGPASGLLDAKYVCLRGSATGLFGADARRGHHCVLLVEGEFDALLAWQEAADLVDVLTFGSASNRPDAAAQMILMAARRLLIAYDADPAGAAGSARWLSRFPRAVPVVLPSAGSARPKDLTEFARAGGNIRSWVSSLLR